MSKLYINTNSIKTHFNPLIDDSITLLNNAIKIANELDIPSGFSYKTYLNSLKPTLEEYKKGCVLIKDFVANSIIDYNSLSNDIISLFDKLEINIVKERNQIIK